MVAEAEGQASRFNAILTEYQDAPAIMRERLYLDTMSEVYGETAKVMVDVSENSPLMVLPLDRLGSGTSGASGQAGDDESLDPRVLERLGASQSSSRNSSNSNSSNGIRREGRQ